VTATSPAAPAPTWPGTIVLLNGVSSAGKTSLARALLEVLDDPYSHVSIDAFEAMVRRRLALPGAHEFATACLMPVMYASAAFATAGVGVVVDTVLADPAWLNDAVRRFAPFRVLFVGVRCALPELQRRERARRDRRIGLAESQLALVHAHGPYDLDVDTTTATPEACALRVTAYLGAGAEPMALRAGTVSAVE
jgi:chloramphenicol 3-O phosphotransferase